MNISNKTLKKIINETIAHFLNEDAMALSDSFEEGLMFLEQSTKRLKAFIQEYGILSDVLVQSAKQVGLTFVKADNEDFDIEDALNGYSFNFTFIFALPENNWSDEEKYEKGEIFCQELEYAIGKPQIGTYSISPEGDTVVYDYKFKLV